jgi:hypothetical protein
MQSSSQVEESSSTQLLKCRVRGNPRTHVNSNAEGRQRGKPSGETLEVDLKKQADDEAERATNRGDLGS